MFKIIDLLFDNCWNLGFSSCYAEVHGDALRKRDTNFTNYHKLKKVISLVKQKIFITPANIRENSCNLCHIILPQPSQYRQMNILHH